MLTTCHPQTGWMIFHLCLQTSGNEASSQMAGPSPQQIVALLIPILHQSSHFTYSFMSFHFKPFCSVFQSYLQSAFSSSSANGHPKCRYAQFVELKNSPSVNVLLFTKSFFLSFFLSFFYMKQDSYPGLLAFLKVCLTITLSGFKYRTD